MPRTLPLLAALGGLLALLPASAGAADAPTLPSAASLATGYPEFEDALTLRAEERAAASAPAAPPSMQDVIAAAFAPLGPDAVGWAEQIAFCESRYDPNAVNAASNAEGLFQFLPSTWRGTPEAAASPFDPAANAQAAVWLYQTYGPSQWACQA